MDNDGRRYRRKPGLTLASYDALDEQGLVCDRGVVGIAEISLDGLSFASPRPLEPDQTVIIEIQLRNDIVKVQGPVVRVSPREGGDYLVAISVARSSPDYSRALAAHFPHR